MWKPKYFHEIDDEHRVEDDVRVGEPQLDEARRARAPPACGRPGRPAGASGARRRRDHLGEHERREEEHPEQRPAPHPLVEQHRDAERERQLQDQRQHEDDPVVPRAPAEHGSANARGSSARPTKSSSGSEAVPVEAAVVERLDDRHEHEQHVERERRAQEQQTRSPAPRRRAGGAGRPRGRRTGGRRPARSPGRDGRRRLRIRLGRIRDLAGDVLGRPARRNCSTASLSAWPTPARRPGRGRAGRRSASAAGVEHGLQVRVGDGGLRALRHRQDAVPLAPPASRRRGREVLRGSRRLGRRVLAEHAKPSPPPKPSVGVAVAAVDRREREPAEVSPRPCRRASWRSSRRVPTGPSAPSPPCRCHQRRPAAGAVPPAWPGSRPGTAPARSARWSCSPAFDERLAVELERPAGLLHRVLAADAQAR